MTAGDWALIVLAVFWAALVVFLALVSVNLFRVLASTRELIDGVRTGTVPLLSEVHQTVTLTNRELDRVDAILASAGGITRSVERVATLMDQLLTTPLIKAISFSYGTQRALKRFRGEAT